MSIHVLHEGATSRVNESCHTWRSRVTREWVLSQMRYSCHTYRSGSWRSTWTSKFCPAKYHTRVWVYHITHLWVMKESCHVYIRHVSHARYHTCMSESHMKWFMPHIKELWYVRNVTQGWHESCHTWIRHITCVFQNINETCHVRVSSLCHVTMINNIIDHILFLYISAKELDSFAKEPYACQCIPSLRSSRARLQRSHVHTNDTYMYIYVNIYAYSHMYSCIHIQAKSPRSSRCPVFATCNTLRALRSWYTCRVITVCVLQYVAVCCSMLQFVPVRYCMLQCVAVC